MNRRPRLEIVAPGASPAEAAAVVAALERFMRDTAPSPVAPRDPGDPWQLTARSEAVGEETSLTPWGDPDPWRG
ncbi:MAG TPA: hypothetical protein VGY97_03175 [Solirubrobacteraceae bacterium]|jgi:hypothetical protein|nr:hypothetical protein [Solirubrobacteraceae bacterium]